MHSTEPGFDSTEMSNDWIAAHIQQGHGPLGAVYPDVSFGVEGDTPSFLSLIPNGLNAPEHPDWGGWGGRYEFYTPALGDYQSGRLHRQRTCIARASCHLDQRRG